MRRPRSRLWRELSTAEFAGLDMGRVIAVQPVGAIEQHGPHLPVEVDTAIVDAIVARAVATLPDDIQVLVLPTTMVGKSNEHLAFPGTLSHSAETLTRMWIELGQCVARAGCRKMLFFNAHGGQPQIVEIVCRELRVAQDLFAVGAFWEALIDASDLVGADERRHGIHGGETETSVMLALRPDLVDMTRAQHFGSLSQRLAEQGGLLSIEGGVGFGWAVQDLNEHGVTGNAAAADAARGETLLARAAAGLVRLLGEIDRFPLSNLRAETAFGPAREL